MQTNPCPAAMCWPASRPQASPPLATPAFAKAPLLNTQAPGFYRFKIGAIEATVVSDGPLDLGAPQPDIFKGVSKEEFGKTLTDNFLPTDKVQARAEHAGAQYRRQAGADRHRHRLRRN